MEVVENEKREVQMEMVRTVSTTQHVHRVVPVIVTVVIPAMAPSVSWMVSMLTPRYLLHLIGLLCAQGLGLIVGLKTLSFEHM